MKDLATIVGTEFDAVLDLGGEWDGLLAASNVDSIFLSSAWLRAWRETLGADRQLLIAQIRQRGELIAAAAFQCLDGVVEFAGRGSSDYCGIVVPTRVDAATSKYLTWELLRAVAERAVGFVCFRLSGLVIEDSNQVDALHDSEKGFFVNEIDRIMAPYRVLSAADRTPSKKARQRERALRKSGPLVLETFRNADDILPQLDEFFEQHVRRWSNQETRSLFEDPQKRDFYRSVTRYLSASGTVRFTTARLDSRMIASHFGFRYRDRYLYYKPAFEPDFARLSPGIVLVEHLLRIAADENAGQFDFLIGDEQYKHRFATATRTVVQLHVTKSMWAAALRRGKAVARKVRDAGRRALVSDRDPDE